MTDTNLPTNPTNPFDNVSPSAEITVFEITPSAKTISVGGEVQLNVSCELTDGSGFYWMLIPAKSSDDSILAPANDWQFCRTFAAQKAGTATISVSLTNQYGSPVEASCDITVTDDS